jgi:hypothetical protein
MKTFLSILLLLNEWQRVVVYAASGLVRGTTVVALEGADEQDEQRSLQTSGTLTGLDLINTMSGTRITTLSNNQVIAVNTIPGMTTPSFNINATFVGSGIQSVGFRYNASSQVWTENAAPWAFCGNSGPVYSNCAQLKLGRHTVTATPFSGSGLTGTAGAPINVTFTIVASVPPPTKAPVKPPTNAPVKAPTNAPTNAPVNDPTNAPVTAPSNAAVKDPTIAPVKAPTMAPKKDPTNAPVKAPTKAPTTAPTKAPAKAPSK